MDTKLKKLLERSTPSPSYNHNLPDEYFYQDICSKLFSETNFLITTPLGSEKTSLAQGTILQAKRSGAIWYVAPSIALTTFRLFYLKSNLGNEKVAVMTDLNKSAQMDNRVVIWSLESLKEHLPDLGRLPSPSLIIFDDAEYLGHPQIGTILEGILLCLSVDIPILLLISSITNALELAAWLEKIRHRPCRLMEMNLPQPIRIPAFLSSHWDIMPLLDGKALTGKVKHYLKEQPLFPNARSPRFIQNLISFLREEKLAPAAILMPSEKSCNLAAKACLQVMKNAGEVLTEPQIASLLDRQPFLKEYPFLPIALSTGVAPFHFGHHPCWCELVEHFLMHNRLDIVFSTIRAAGTMTVGMRSLVFCASHQQYGREFFEITQWEMDRLKRLEGSKRSGEQAGCLVVAHTPLTDAVRLKDLWLPRQSPLLSALEGNCQTVLSLLSCNRKDMELLDHSLLAFQNPSAEDSRLEELVAELRAELPEARCTSDIQAVTSLIDLRLKLVVRLNEQAKIIKKSLSEWKKNQLDKEQQELEGVLSRFPCEKCPHFPICQKRGSRKIRALLDEYHEKRKHSHRSIQILRLDFLYYLKCLQEFGLVDQGLGLTKEGVLALKTGLKFPMPLIECIRENQIPFHDQALSFALLGGFVEYQDWDFPKKIETEPEYYQELKHEYAKMEPVLIRTEEGMLRFGIYPSRPIFLHSAILLASRKEKDVESLARNTGISMGDIVRLIQKATYLVDRITASL